MKQWFSHPHQFVTVTYVVMYCLDILVDTLQRFRAERGSIHVGVVGVLTCNIMIGFGGAAKARVERVTVAVGPRYSIIWASSSFIPIWSG